MSQATPTFPAVWPYELPAKPARVVAAGEFGFAAAYLDHAHIYGMCGGLIEAGAELRWVYDPDPQKISAFRAQFPDAKIARSFEEIFDDPKVRLIAAAAVPSERAAIGCRAMKEGRDYFTDKAPFTTLEQLAEVKEAVNRTGRKYLVYYSERLHVEAAVYASDLLRQGAIGRVIQVLGLGPHRLSKATRPAWFFEKAKTGGILCDLASHQCEQFLTYSGATDATVLHAACANYANPDTPEFEDFGEASLLGNNGATHYVRVDWYTPSGLRNWGDGRTLILGDKGYLELRKYIDVGQETAAGDQLYLVDGRGEYHLSVAGRIGFPFFGQLILDCIHRTETAMTQSHALKAAELALKAQAAARRLTPQLG